MKKYRYFQAGPCRNYIIAYKDLFWNSAFRNMDFFTKNMHSMILVKTGLLLLQSFKTVITFLGYARVVSKIIDTRVLYITKH